MTRPTKKKVKREADINAIDPTIETVFNFYLEALTRTDFDNAKRFNHPLYHMMLEMTKIPSLKKSLIQLIVREVPNDQYCWVKMLSDIVLDTESNPLES